MASSSPNNSSSHGQRMPNCVLPPRRKHDPYHELEVAQRFMASDDYKRLSAIGPMAREIKETWETLLEHYKENVALASIGAEV